MFDFNKTLHRLTWHLAHRLTDWAIYIFGMFVLVPKYVKWLVVNYTQLRHHAAMGSGCDRVPGTNGFSLSYLFHTVAKSLFPKATSYE